MQFRNTPVLSNDPKAAQTASDLKKDHPFRFFKDEEEIFPDPK
jgi:hypothetical protein